MQFKSLKFKCHTATSQKKLIVLFMFMCRHQYLKNLDQTNRRQWQPFLDKVYDFIFYQSNHLYIVTVKISDSIIESANVWRLLGIIIDESHSRKSQITTIQIAHPNTLLTHLNSTLLKCLTHVK